MLCVLSLSGSRNSYCKILFVLSILCPFGQIYSHWSTFDFSGLVRDEFGFPSQVIRGRHNGGQCFETDT